MSRRTLIQYVHAGLKALAIPAALLSMALAFICLPEPDRNPASPEFGWLQWNWAAAFLKAAVLLALAIWGSRGRIRLVLVVLALANCATGIEPALQLYHYRLGR